MVPGKMIKVKITHLEDYDLIERSLVNIPNLLTLLDIISSCFMFLVKIPYGLYIAAAVFIIAASTDGLDGHIARKTKQITNLVNLWIL